MCWLEAVRIAGYVTWSLNSMATHSSILACRIPGTAEPGGLSSVGSHRVGHDWSDLAAVAANSKLSLYQWVWNAWTSLENITQEDELLQCYVQLSQTRLKGVYTAQKEDLHQGFNKYEHKWITSPLKNLWWLFHENWRWQWWLQWHLTAWLKGNNAIPSARSQVET